MFIHWGLYAVLGEGEWVQQAKQIPVADYENLRSQFNPVHFDPKARADDRSPPGHRP